MDGQQVKAFFVEQIEFARSSYIKDLQCLTEEDLARSPGGQARAPFDYTYEVAYANNRFAARLRGDRVEKFPEGFITLPEQYKTKQAAVDFINGSTDAFLAAFNQVPDEDLLKPIVLESGTATALEYAMMCANHMSYHDAQLNVVQTMKGDLAVHWSEG
jgi:hypothetical protein